MDFKLKTFSIIIKKTKKLGPIVVLCTDRLLNVLDKNTAQEVNVTE